MSAHPSSTSHLRPLRPKRPYDDPIPELFRTPKPSVSPAVSGPGQSSSPSATAPEPINPQASGSCHAPNTNNGHPWPSQIAQTSSTMWLLPPYSGQSSAIALLLQKEIQSHNVTREMLHATEQRRMEAIQYCNRLLADNRVWSAAYNNLTAALHRCSQEYSRLSAENEAMRAQMHDLNSQVLRRRLSRHLGVKGSESSAPDAGPCEEGKLCVPGIELEDSPSPFSPEV
ncbi:hypothetical protein K469DRAFT_747999 [Zopfia rhizophila CBS 207.26]|uniref:Uncharacterized protein n=1 Tax=Zopfia rhizophila CBS 207.26 TaxID=1314779 RepID=A0A6A6EF95_9PEZI|nr:hypothetical protein K469DRAFT_747999 [Zopfia rhizophila CBS 207.26]